MTKLLSRMNRQRRQIVINRLKQEARYRLNIAKDLADNDQELRVLLDWAFGPAAYAIEDLHREVMNDAIRQDQEGRQ